MDNTTIENTSMDQEKRLWRQIMTRTFITTFVRYVPVEAAPEIWRLVEPGASFNRWRLNAEKRSKKTSEAKHNKQQYFNL